MTPSKAHIVFGLVLLIVGIAFDFFYVEWKLSEAFKTDPASYLASWEKNLLDLTKSYMIIFGLLSLAFAWLHSRFGGVTKIDWLVFWLLSAGAVLIIATGFWYAAAGPSFRWETRCTVLTIGLLAALTSLALEAYRALTAKSA